MRSDREDAQPLRGKVTRLGKRSFHKSYYPEYLHRRAIAGQIREAIDRGDDIILFVDAGTGHIVDANGISCELLGYRHDALTGLKIGDLLDEEAHAAFQCLLTGHASHLALTTTLRGNGGLMVPCELSAQTAHIDGKPTVVVIAREATAAKPAGEEREGPGDAYQAIFNSVDDGIVIMDAGDGRTIDLNEGMRRMLGYSPQDVPGVDFLGLIASGAGQSKEAILQQLKVVASGGTIVMELPFKGKDNKLFWAEVGLKYRRIGGEDRAIAAVHDITEHKGAESRAKASLQEKEVLIKEIHHRVKNNLQVISSLLNIQSQYLSDPQDAKLFEESQDRIKTMALVHEKLYHSSDLSSIDFGSYIEQLAASLFRTYGTKGGRARLYVDVKDVSLEADLAVPCGLIVNELVTNALKHAFPEGREGAVTIFMRPEGDGYVLQVSDDGVGMAPGFDIARATSFGLKLVVMLAKQLEGTATMDTSKGVKFTIRFKK